MADLPDAVYEAAAVALHDADCGDSICSAGIIHSVYGAGARAVVDAVAPLLIAKGRRQAARQIIARDETEGDWDINMAYWAAVGIAEGTEQA